MEVRITARHGNISENEDALIREKVEKLGRIFDRAHDARVVVEHFDDRSAVEMTVGAPRGVQLAAHAEAADLRTAVQQAESKLEAQLRRLKDRLLDRRPKQRPIPADQ